MCVFSQAHERLEDVKLEAVQENNVELVNDILGDISGLTVNDDGAAELTKILQEPHFQVTNPPPPPSPPMFCSLWPTCISIERCIASLAVHRIILSPGDTRVARWNDG